MHIKHSLWAGSRNCINWDSKWDAQTRSIPQYSRCLNQGWMPFERPCHSLTRSYRLDAAISWYSFMVCNTQVLLALKIPGGLNQSQKLGLFSHCAPCSTLGSYKPSCTCSSVHPALLPSRVKELLTRINNMVVNLRRCLDNHVCRCH